MATLDAATWAKVEAVLTNPEIIAAELARQRTADPTAADVEAVERRLAEVQRKQHNLVRRLADVDDDDIAAVVKAELETMAAHGRQLTAERDTLTRAREGWRLAQDRLTDLEAWCRTVATNVTELSYQEKRLALEALGVKVRLWPCSQNPRFEITMDIDIVEPTACRWV